MFVAGAGFLTDAYDVRPSRPGNFPRQRDINVSHALYANFYAKIFAVNTVLPMLNVVYWQGNMPKDQELLINLAVLVGTFLSQFIVGVLADRYGRKRMYGIELCILMLATVLVAIASEGALRGTNRLGWIVAWRFVMGLGIGKAPLVIICTARNRA